MELPAKGKAVVRDRGFEVQVTIPARKNIFIIAFLSFWMLGWLFGEVSVIGALIPGSSPAGTDVFLVIWLAGWTLGGVMVLYVLAWNFAGKEVVIARPEAIEIQRNVLFIKRNKKYSAISIKNLRVNRESTTTWFGRQDAWNRRGTIAFDYGMKTVRFASGIDEAEANHLLDLFRQRGISASSS